MAEQVVEVAADALALRGDGEHGVALLGGLELLLEDLLADAVADAPGHQRAHHCEPRRRCSISSGHSEHDHPRLISSIVGTAHRQGSSSTWVIAWNITMNSTFAPSTGIRSSSDQGAQLRTRPGAPASGYRPMPVAVDEQKCVEQQQQRDRDSPGARVPAIQATEIGIRMNSTGGRA